MTRIRNGERPISDNQRAAITAMLSGKTLCVLWGKPLLYDRRGRRRLSDVDKYAFEALWSRGIVERRMGNENYWQTWFVLNENHPAVRKEVGKMALARTG